MGITSLGHTVFAATMITLGILGLIQGGFTPTWSGVPKGLPAREALAYLCAVLHLQRSNYLWWRSPTAAYPGSPWASASPVPPKGSARLPVARPGRVQADHC